MHRWWRDYEQECAAWTGSAPGAWFRIGEERTESGIVARVTLYTLQPTVAARRHATRTVDAEVTP